MEEKTSLQSAQEEIHRLKSLIQVINRYQTAYKKSYPGELRKAFFSGFENGFLENNSIKYSPQIAEKAWEEYASILLSQDRNFHSDPINLGEK